MKTDSEPDLYWILTISALVDRFFTTWENLSYFALTYSTMPSGTIIYTI